MNYPIKTLNQIQPILRGFRKAAGLTQQAMAEKLGITQQSYAQLEANPASASIERLFKVLRMLDVELVLTANAPSVPDQESTAAAADHIFSHKDSASLAQKNAGKDSAASGNTTATMKASNPAQPRRIAAASKKKESW